LLIALFFFTADMALAADNALPPLPALPNLPSSVSNLPSAATNPSQDLKLPGEAALPPLPQITPLPSDTVSNNVSEKKESADAFPVLDETEKSPKKGKNSQLKSGKVATLKDADEGKGKKHARKTPKKENNKEKEVSVADAKKIRLESHYIQDRLPDAIYQKSYNPDNRHLPIAFYEKEYDGIVFSTAMHDDVNGLRAMLDSGRSVNLRNENGDTPLLVAVKNNSAGTVKLLVMRNADARIKDKNGYTASEVANSIGNDRIKRIFAGLE